MKKQRVLLLIAVLVSALLPVRNILSAAPSPYDLIAVINDLRRNNGLAEMEIHNALMASSQLQSDYLGSTYGTSFPSWDDGHTGAGGTKAIDRAIAAGYPAGPGWNVVEVKIMPIFL